MKKLFFYLFLAIPGLCLAQKVADPVIMTINGKNVPRSEFEYSYNKNGSVEGAVEKKSVEEYVDMFINYKLKVAEAESVGLDKNDSYKKEFLQYRDMQLTPYMLDEFFIDSIASMIYDRTVKQLDGKDVLQPSHILIRVKQKDDEGAKAAAKLRADSIYKLAVSGADFAQLARKFSQDPGSGRNGGKLGMIGPGTTVKSFEDAAYSLQTGEISKPVFTDFGWHIIKMDDRRPFGSYESRKKEIVEALKAQGIEDASAEYRIGKIVEASNGRLTREAVLDSVLAAHENENMDLKYLVQEYHDGLLLYEISKRDLWDRVKADTVALENYFKANKKKYRWTEPYFRGYVVQAKDKKLLKAAKKLLKKADAMNFRKLVKDAFNKDSVKVVVAGQYFCKKGENDFVDFYVFGEKKEPRWNKAFPFCDVAGKKLSQPKSYKDVRSEVEEDVQTLREKEWVEKLRKKYTFRVYDDVVKTVNKH